MRADGLLAMLDRWGRAALPGAVLLFFVLLTLAPLRAPYLSDALPLLPALVVFQFSLATPERLPGPLLLAMGVLLDLLLGGPGGAGRRQRAGLRADPRGRRGQQPALSGGRADRWARLISLGQKCCLCATHSPARSNRAPPSRTPSPAAAARAAARA